MIIKAGLRVLTVGVVMLCGVAAEAATWQLPLLPSGSFTIEGQVTGPTVLDVHLITEFPADTIIHPRDIYSLQSNINLAVADPNTGTVLDSVTLVNNRSYFPGFYSALTQQSSRSLTIGPALRTITFFQQVISAPGVFSANGSTTFLLTLADNLSPSIGTIAPDPVPLPAALPLFASVLGIGGWLGYRRKRAQGQAIAA